VFLGRAERNRTKEERVNEYKTKVSVCGWSLGDEGWTERRKVRLKWDKEMTVPMVLSGNERGRAFALSKYASALVNPVQGCLDLLFRKVDPRPLFASLI
jgi:hypothetical protein